MNSNACVGISPTARLSSRSSQIGNAPWGDNLITDAAVTWSRDPRHAWRIANKDIGGLFLAKSSHLINSTGRVAMIQSANALLFNRGPTANHFRHQLFTTIRVEEIYNLSALRFKIFNRKTHVTKSSIAPACVVIIGKGAPVPQHYIAYVSPKQIKTRDDEFSIVVEPGDRKKITIEEAALDPLVWTVLMWGGQRDRALIRKLQSFASLGSLEEPKMHKRQGIVYGDRTRHVVQLRNRRLFIDKKFPEGSSRYIDARQLPLAGDLQLHSRDSTDFQAFASPQLLVKQAWEKASGRFQARLVANAAGTGVLCSKSYMSVHAPTAVLDSAWLTFNSKLTVYFLHLTSGRIAAYRPEALINELEAVPLAPLKGVLPDQMGSVEEIDKLTYELFGLKDSEQLLVEDMLDFSLKEFRDSGKRSTLARMATPIDYAARDLALEAYCTYVIQVLKAGFGKDKIVTATVLKGPDDTVPYRMVAFRLGERAMKEVTFTQVQTSALIHELERLDRSTGVDGARRGIYTERVVRIYDVTDGIPTIFVVKPIALKYWARSAGLRDGDEIASDLFQWQQPETFESYPS